MDDFGFDLSRRRVTLSTSGLVPQIYKLAEETNVALAVSLHAPDDALRNELVPINRKHPIAELLTACWHYLDEQNGRSVTFEYVMLEGVNDSPAQARALARLLKGHPAKVNLIPFNPFPGTRYRRSPRAGYPALSRRAVAARRARDRAPYARRRYRRRLRPARRTRHRPHHGAPRQQGHSASRFNHEQISERSVVRPRCALPVTARRARCCWPPASTPSAAGASPIRRMPRSPTSSSASLT